MIEIGTLLQERYLIEKQIGAGGMGAVYLAIDKRFDNHVAIKETFYKDDEFGEAFEREARLLNALQHHVLPHVTDYFSENNGYFLVMQFIEGEDLSDILKRDGAFPVKDVIRWTHSLLDALDYLHSQTPPIIHRDIKPHNLKLTPRGEIMLLDFGLAKLNSEDTLGAVSVFGYSRTYSPLEQIQGTGTDARSDIFALGATVYHLLTGKPPVDALTRAAAIVNGKDDPIRLADELNPEISPAVASVINSALALNPENRFISAQAMRQALEYAVEEDNPKANFIENAAQPAETIPQVVPIGGGSVVVDAADNDNSPALEAFASNAEQNSFQATPPNADDFDLDSMSNGVRENSNSNKPVTAPPIIIETSQKGAPTGRPKRNNAIFAAAAAVLIFGVIAAAFYFSGQNAAANENSLTPSVINNSTANTNSGNSGKRASDTETIAESKTKPAVSDKSSKSDAKSTTEQNILESRTDAVESTAPTTRKNPPPTRNNQDNVEEQIPINEAEPEVLPETEDRNNRNERRRRIDREIPDEMSEEEFEQMRRERRERRRERRERRNNDPIPY